MAFASFDLVGFGTLEVPPHPLRFAFQVDISPKESPAQVMFGHVSQESNGGGKISSHGFAIRLDLATGEIWDLLNESGLIGMVVRSRRLFTHDSRMKNPCC